MRIHNLLKILSALFIIPIYVEITYNYCLRVLVCYKYEQFYQSVSHYVKTTVI